MVFSSIIFLFYFLPVVLLFYFTLRAGAERLPPGAKERICNGFLLVSSLFFYTWGEQLLVLVMFGSICVDYSSGLIIAGGFRRGDAGPERLRKGGPRSAKQKLALTASIFTNLGILGFFKYFNFGADNAIAFLTSVGLESLAPRSVLQITLPLGISFYTFQSMSYTIDVYRGDTTATRDFLTFASFVSLFPQLVAGPIVRYRDIARQLVERVVNRPLLASGISRFTVGLGKKVLLANTFSVTADAVFAMPSAELSPGLAWLGVVCYALQIYFDFSGYSDMAIGLGRMLGFRFLENFNYPYISRSIQEFWRRWHISLSRWFRDYLYIPLGGGRVAGAKVLRNLVVVFVLCGLWHGASWTFVVWGLYHGVFLVAERVGLGAALKRLPAAARHLYVVLVVLVGWVLFRAETFPQSIDFLSAMFGRDGSPVHGFTASYYLRSDLLAALAFGVAFSCPLAPAIRAMLSRTLERRGFFGSLVVQGSRILVLGTILALCSLVLSSGAHNPFIYFRF